MPKKSLFFFITLNFLLLSQYSVAIQTIPSVIDDISIKETENINAYNSEVKFLPTATISYNGPFCLINSNSQPVTLVGTGAFTGGTFSSSVGLTIDSITGAITPSTSIAGTYTVTYTVPASPGSASFPVTTNVTITHLPIASISYASSFCITDSMPQSITLTGSYAYTGGVYSALPVGLTINSSSGVITPNRSKPGTYQVIYTIPATGGCPSTLASTNVTINDLPTASISYASPFCITDSIPQLVTLTGTYAYTGGVYTASPGGLSINSASGVITPNTSSFGNYQVTYTIPASGGCSATSASTNVTINQLPISTVTIFQDTLLCANGGVSYKWINCSDNQEIVGAYNAIFKPLTSGNYAVIATNATYCSDTSNCLTYSLNTSSLSDLTNEYMSVYPNPSNGIFTILSPSEIVKVSVLDITGRTLMVSNKNIINIENYDSGIYYFIVNTVNGSLIKEVVKY